MKISILVEGKTEKAFMPYLREFLKTKLEGKMPNLDPVPSNGKLNTDDKLKRQVDRLLNDKKNPSNAVIALTDIYPEFTDANDARAKLKSWVGKEKRFHAHVAQYDFEAWLLPYWEKIQKITGSNQKSPGVNPETINHGNSPAYRIADVYRTGPKTKGRRSYKKAIDAGAILKGEDLLVAIKACSELKSFVNTIIGLCDKSQVIP